MPKYTDLFKKLNNKRFMAVMAAAGVAGGTALSGVDITKIGQQVSLTPEQEYQLIKKVSPVQSQRDGLYSTGKYAYWRTCCSVTSTMFLNTIRPLIGKGYVKDDDYIESLKSRDLETTIHDNHTRILALYGVRSKWDDTGNKKKLLATLAEGYVVPVNILHKGTPNQPYGGHCVVLYGYDKTTKKFKVGDPWGEYGLYKLRPYQTTYDLTEGTFDKIWQGGARYMTEEFKKELTLKAGLQ